jgi:hypothetical protein
LVLPAPAVAADRALDWALPPVALAVELLALLEHEVVDQHLPLLAPAVVALDLAHKPVLLAPALLQVVAVLAPDLVPPLVVVVLELLPNRQLS